MGAGKFNERLLCIGKYERNVGLIFFENENIPQAMT